MYLFQLIDLPMPLLILLLQQLQLHLKIFDLILQTIDVLILQTLNFRLVLQFRHFAIEHLRRDRLVEAFYFLMGGGSEGFDVERRAE